MTDPKDAERLAEIDRIRGLNLPGNSMSRMYNYTTVWWLRDLLASRDATIADLERKYNELRMRFMVPPECDANCTISDCPYIHQWTERESPEVADLERRLAEARADCDGLAKALSSIALMTGGNGMEKSRIAMDAIGWSVIPEAPPVAEASTEGEWIDENGYLHGLMFKSQRATDRTPVAEASGELPAGAAEQAAQDDSRLIAALNIIVPDSDFADYKEVTPQPTTDHLRHAMGEPTENDRFRADQLWTALKGETKLGWAVDYGPADEQHIKAICAAALWSLRCATEAPALTADHTERARAILNAAHRSWIQDKRDLDLRDVQAKYIADALADIEAAAERAGAEKIRALDEAARAVDAAWVEFSEHGNHDARLITALYARLDDLNAALVARDAALTEGEGR